MELIINEKVNIPKVIFGNDSRFPTLTAVKFIDNDLIVAAHRGGSKVYLIEKGKVIDSIKSKYPDLLDVDKNLIVIANFSNEITFININENKKLIFNKIIRFPKDKIYHGVKIKDGLIYLANTIGQGVKPTKPFLLTKFDNTKIEYISLPLDYRQKDIAFWKDKMIVLHQLNFDYDIKKHYYDATIALYSNNYKLLNSYQISECHVDCLVVKDDNIYITSQSKKHGGGILRFNFITKILEISKVQDFPHGLDIKNDLFAYTCYSDSSLNIKSLKFELY
jgi:hypothetical protein